MAATFADHADMVSLLLEHGADPDKPCIDVDLQHTCSTFNAGPGERALHIAARRGQVKAVRVLLNRSRADFNATDLAGYTPLTATTSSPQASVEVVRLLLEAGADPALAEHRGFTPLHLVAANGHSLDLIDMLYSRAPATLNSCTSSGATPLLSACCGGYESMAFKLLSLGATQVAPDDVRVSPLVAAAQNGFVGVVRILIGEEKARRRAVWGDSALATALYKAVMRDRAGVLRLLLTVDGEERRSEWANTDVMGKSLLHFGAGYCCSAAVSILLEAGAAEAAHDVDGRIPQNVIGAALRRDDFQIIRENAIAVRRMLLRGPAYRARSWAWPSDERDVGGGSDGDTAAAAAAVLSSPQSVPKPPPAIRVRIFRPQDECSSKFFVRLVSR